MRLTKLSLVAALLMGSSAFAIENIKVSGDAKLFYSTQNNSYTTNTTNTTPAVTTYDKNDNASLFDKSTSTGEAAVDISLSADLTTGVSAGATLSAITTLGLYNNLVSSTWTGGTEDNFLFSEAWLAGTAGKTTGKIGRMLLDTPLVFSETWSVVPNTFEAAVVINQDIPNTTLVGAYVGQSNHNQILGDGLSENKSSFESFYKGAYAIGAVNNSWNPLTAQAWYFDATQTVKAYWLQADLDLSGLNVGLQYTAQEAQATGSKTQSAYAAKIGYTKKDVFSISGAFSQVDSEVNGFENVGTNYAGSQSKLYTEAWWRYGVISKPDTTAVNLTATGSVSDIDLGLYYTSAIQKNGFNTNTDAAFTEATFEVAKSFGPLDVGVYYIFTQDDNLNQKSATEKGDAYDTVQVYLTYNY